MRFGGWRGGNWITGAIQDKIFCSIDFHAFKHAVESDITKAVGKVEVEGGPRRSIVSRMREQNDKDGKRHSDRYDVHCDFEGRGGEPDCEYYQL